MKEHIEKAKEILKRALRFLSGENTAVAGGCQNEILKALAELEAAESKPQKCRWCSECQYEEHHWIETCDEKSGEPIMICKHCPATKPYPDLIDQGDDMPEPMEFTKKLRTWADKYNKREETSVQQLALEACAYLQSACAHLQSQAERLAKMERMVEIPDLLKDGFLAVGQELIRRDMLIAARDNEIERLKRGIELYIILRDRELFTPEDVLEKIGEFTGNKYEAGYLISSIRRDLEKALKEE